MGLSFQHSYPLLAFILPKSILCHPNPFLYGFRLVSTMVENIDFLFDLIINSSATATPGAATGIGRSTATAGAISHKIAV